MSTTLRVRAGGIVTEGSREVAEAAIRQALDNGHERIVVERLADPPVRSYPDAITSPLDPPTVDGPNITRPV